ncbi:MAG: acyl carrier protein [bacterium]|nr:acyl carrier protein [bacterium]
MAPEATSQDEIRRVVYEFFADECEVETSELTEETNVIEELEGDSLMLLALLEKVCKMYGLTIELKALGKHLMKKNASTIGEIVELTCALVEHGDNIINVEL